MKNIVKSGTISTVIAGPMKFCASLSVLQVLPTASSMLE